MCNPISKGLGLFGCGHRMIRRELRLFMIALALMLAVGSELVQAVPVCIPQAVGVPALSGPPNWLTGVEPNLWPRLDDPRWRGATSRSLGGSGASEHVSFRALRDLSALYLSWYVKVAPQLSPAEALYVAFSPGGGAPDQLIGLYPNNVSGMLATEVNVVPPSLSSNLAALRTGSGGMWVSQALPTWVASNTRVSRDLTTQTWAINMKVPIAAAYNDGINLSSDFKMWYEVDVMTAAPGLVPYINDSDINHDLSWVNSQTNSTGWEDFNRTLDSTNPMTACARGVSLAVADVGTKYVDSGSVARPNRISLTGTNTFFAHPKNETANSIPANKICAQFRIANWGTQPDWNSVPNPTTSLWKLISASCPVGPTNPGTITIGAKADIAAPAVGANELTFPWTMTAAERCELVGQSGIPASLAPDGVAIPGIRSCMNTTPTRRLHQCMLVELSGGGLTYTPASVYRNMDFVNASTFTREAEVSVAGLKALPGATQRDVYLYVKTYNLPKDTSAPQTADMLRDFSHVQEILGQDGKDNLLRATTIATGAIPPKFPPLGEDIDLLNQLYPTYVVNAYHDTGRTVTRRGLSYKELQPQSSFGYYIHHEGETSGWQHALDGAQQIAPDFYLIAVPEGGKADIRTTIKARETGTEPKCNCKCMDVECLNKCKNLASNDSGALSGTLTLVGTLGVGGFAFLRRRRNQKSSDERAEG